MRRPSFAIIACLSFFAALSSSQAWAQQQKKSKARVLDARTTRQQLRKTGATSGLSAILGGEYGIVRATPTDKETFGEKNGRTLELKLLSGWLFKDFMIDSGLGFYYYKVRGTERPFVNGERINGDREIAVSGLLLEFTPLYRLTNNFFLGPVTQIKTPGYADYFSEASPSPVLFTGGFQMGLQFFENELNTRLTLKASTNLGLKGWKDIAYLGGVQFGLPFRQPDLLVIKKTTTVNKLREEVEYRKKEFKISLTANVVKLALDNVLTFYVDPEGRPTLTAEAQSFLVDLGGALQSQEGLWETLRIDAQTPGHVKSVHDSLISIGVPSQKVRKGRSTQEVADGGNASVDFTFSGVKNSALLADTIRNSMKLAKVPENCTKEGICE